MAYDPLSRGLLLFGGELIGDPFANDLWGVSADSGELSAEAATFDRNASRRGVHILRDVRILNGRRSESSSSSPTRRTWSPVTRGLFFRARACQTAS
jgi:hypothetical protein